MEEEIWLPVKGYEGRYEVSHFGNIRGIRRRDFIILKPHDNGSRLAVNLFNADGNKTTLVHHVVLKTFNCDKPLNLECCHNDGNYKNNYIGNLRWDTRKSNIADSVKHGTFKRDSGNDCVSSKLTESDVLEIRELIIKGITHRKIGEMYNVHHSTIGSINRGLTWKI